MHLKYTFLSCITLWGNYKLQIPMLSGLKENNIKIQLIFRNRDGMICRTRDCIYKEYQGNKNKIFQKTKLNI